jgi:hypothetical protein
MSADQTLRGVVAALDDAGIAHMLAGSFASSLHGVARTTADIDLVVIAEPASIDRLLVELDRDRFYVDEGAAREVVPGGQFNLIDKKTGWKVDLVHIRDRPFSVAEFARRVPATILGVPVFVATAEDTVLAKLEWSKASGSDRQVQDVVDLLRVRGPDLDDDYLDRWADELGIADLLRSVRDAQ